MGKATPAVRALQGASQPHQKEQALRRHEDSIHRKAQSQTTWVTKA